MSKYHSKNSFKCQIYSCEKVFRGDALHRHYRTFVKFDKCGNPLVPGSKEFKALKIGSQNHTRYFHENGYTRTKLPVLKTPVDAPENPWQAIKKVIVKDPILILMMKHKQNLQ